MVTARAQTVLFFNYDLFEINNSGAVSEDSSNPFTNVTVITSLFTDIDMMTDCQATVSKDYGIQTGGGILYVVPV